MIKVGEEFPHVEKKVYINNKPSQGTSVKLFLPFQICVFKCGVLISQ